MKGVLIHNPSHPRANKSGRVYEHILVVEKAMGKYLSLSNPVHHVDGNQSNNKNDNLVVCENKVYHHLLHSRAKALKMSGNANYRLCEYCKKWDDPSNMASTTKNRHRHKECLNKHFRERRLNEKILKALKAFKI